MKYERKWYLVDAENKILGRLSSKISIILQGKNKIEYLPSINIGDYVVIINSKNILLTGNKLNSKIYYKYTGYIGNLKKQVLKDLIIKNPNLVIFKSIKNMLPRNKLRKLILKRLKIYIDSNHKHKSQNLIKLNI